ncbi:MAG TPA: 23S rRNA (uracil(1939)-C(5))-methyltransferase RlmD [Terriglobales bacterium]|nr:23S rRNA (uracil(1939)-C(5))-methyltransferase RlmD [Terriglobales bacterium]
MQLTIEKLVYGGDGLARLPADEHGRGKAVFVPFVLPGERVEAALVEEKPGFARARADKVLEASTQRVEPHCPYFQRCGGCHYQHASYEHQLEIKTAILKENLRRIAKLELDKDLKIHPSPAWNYRNQTRLKVQSEPEFDLGYYKFNSHELLPVEECPISSLLINRAIAMFWELGRAGEVAYGVQEIEFLANGDDTQLLIQAYCAPDIRKDTAEQWAREVQSTLPEVAGVVMFKARHSSAAAQGTSDPERVAQSGAAELTYKTDHASYRVSAGAFFQVNRHLTDKLVNVVAAGRSGHTALDLYAGVGLFSAVLSREFAQVIAVESSPTSYADLLYNSPPNVKAVQATVEQYLKNVAGTLQPDLVVVDPPRSGLGESVIQALVTLGAPRITYVSCDPATLSRDLGRLLQSAYRVEEAHMVDLFPQTYHLESVFHLVR